MGIPRSVERSPILSDLLSFLVESGGRGNEQATISTLEEAKLKHLDYYYQKTDRDYSALLDAYTREQDAARKAHCLNVFPPFHLWTPGEMQAQSSFLTPEQIELRNGPSKTIECFRT